MHRLPVHLTLLTVLVAVAGALFAVPVAAETAAARVLFGRGEVIARGPAVGQRVLRRGDPVFDKDTVLVAEGRAQLRFTDGALVSLRANTEFRVDEYRYAGATDGSERGYFSLIKGGLRTVTGAIGRINRATYRVDAAVTTIGIRGTGYNATLCQADCFAPDGTPTEDGLYVGVTVGVISLANNAAVVEVAAGQNAFVRDIDTAPTLVAPEPPAPLAPRGMQTPDFRSGEQRPKMELPHPEVITPPVGGPPPKAY